MNRDSGLSSSLEISQLDIIKQHEGVVNFVPGSFDYESDGFNENRSKHRNDPHTMKKLREKHAKKDKKKVNVSKKRGSNSSGGKARAKRRRVVEVISRDKLRKIGLGIPSSGIDAQYHRLRYATLLCKYGSEKVENGYFSENDDPPRPRSSFTPKRFSKHITAPTFPSNNISLPDLSTVVMIRGKLHTYLIANQQQCRITINYVTSLNYFPTFINFQFYSNCRNQFILSYMFTNNDSIALIAAVLYIVNPNAGMT
ncbi:hypothetical protein FXO38_04292 [Capsicum annuum]|nr:hypothetical protein FXO38_04292 [Capsicum annuum]